MTQIEFVSGVHNRLDYLCRLVRKKLAQERKVVIYCTDQAQLKQVDQALWTFSALDFLPHVYLSDSKAADTPVLLCVDHQATPHEDILINLDQAVPSHFARYAQLVELVGTAPQEVQAGRQRYKHYRDHGYPLNHHSMTQ